MSSHLISLSLLAIISSDGVRDTLERTSEFWFVCLLISSAGVAIGCLLEIGETWTDFRKWLGARKNPNASEEDKSWHKPLAAIGLLLVILGVVGEGVFEALSANVETKLRAHDEQVLADTIVQAGTAKDSADKARAAAAAAILSAKMAGKVADRANSSAATAEGSARTAKKIADGALTEAARLLKEASFRTIPRPAFLKALEAKPKAPVDIWYVKNDPDCEYLAEHIFSLLMEAKWDVVPPRPIQATDALSSDAMSLGAQPMGVSVVAKNMPPSPDGLDPFSVLFNALRDGLGGVGGGWRAAPTMPDGWLRVVVAPRQPLGNPEAGFLEEAHPTKSGKTKRK